MNHGRNFNILFNESIISMFCYVLFFVEIFHILYIYNLSYFLLVIAPIFMGEIVIQNYYQL